MIELKQNKIWSDSLNSILEFNEPWDYVDEHLYKFICFGAGDAGADGADGGGAADDIGFAAPPAPHGPEDITSDEDVDPEDPPEPTIGFDDPTGPLGAGPKGQSDDTGIISASEEEAFDTETLATTGSFKGFSGEKDESIEDLDPGEFPGEQGPFGTSGGSLGTALGFGALSPPPPPLPPPPQFLAPPPPPPKPLAPITKVVEVQPRPILDIDEREKGEELDIGLFNPLGNVEDQDDDLFNALVTDKGLQEFEAITKAEREATKARGFPTPAPHRGPQHDPTITDTDIESMMDDISSKFGITPSILSIALNALGLGIPAVLGMAGKAGDVLGFLGFDDPEEPTLRGAISALGAFFGLPSNIISKGIKSITPSFLSEPIIGARVTPTTTQPTIFGTPVPGLEAPYGKGNVLGGKTTDQDVLTGLTMAHSSLPGMFGTAKGMAMAPVGVSDPGFGGSEFGVEGEKYGGQIGKKSGGLVSLRKAYNGGNISGLASTGTNIIDTINRGLAMPSNIGAVQMQEKLEVNPNNPYTNR